MVLQRTTVFKIMPSGRSVGPTSISENGAETFNCFQNHAFWALRGPSIYSATKITKSPPSQNQALWALRGRNFHLGKLC